MKVGESPTGRAAKYAKIINIKADAELMMKPPDDTGFSPAQQTGLAPLEAGVVAPLIVGARIIGTLSVWSRKQNAFDADFSVHQFDQFFGNG